jgi:hypothetical protein
MALSNSANGTLESFVIRLWRNNHMSGHILTIFTLFRSLGEFTRGVQVQCLEAGHSGALVPAVPSQAAARYLITACCLSDIVDAAT